MVSKSKHFEKFVKDGWRPSYNGEFLDLYNQRSCGKVSGTILCGISYRNMHFIAVEYG